MNQLSKWEKLLLKIRTMSRDVRFNELKKILESYGYIAYNPSAGSSHWTFRKPGRPPITIPKDNPIKLTYVKMVKEIIEVEEENH